MPFATAICTIPVLAAFCGLITSGVVIAFTPTPSNDIFAVLGALLAGIMALIEARTEDRSKKHTIGVFLAAAAAGSMLPGIIVHGVVWKGWLSRESANALIWQVWSFMGLVIGLNGWWILHTVMGAVRRRAEKRIEDFP